MPDSFLGRIALDSVGAMWIGSLLVFLALGDFKKILSRRNLAVVLLLLAAVVLFDYFRIRKNARHLTMGITFLFLVTAWSAAWGLLLAVGRFKRISFAPGLPTGALIVLLAFVLLLNAVTVFGILPDDAGIYTNLGAQRWMETGTIPYGDEMLKGADSPGHGASATYGPLLYVAHMPFQVILGRPDNPSYLFPRSQGYLLPPLLATQLCCFAFQLVGMLALFLIVKELGGTALGLAAAIAYAGSPYVLALGGDPYKIGGLGYISHIAPPAVVLLGLLWRRRPVLSGALLAAGAGVLFWPAFLFPAWFGWHWFRRKGAVAFAAGFLVTGALIGGIVVHFTHAPKGESAVGMFLESTFEHQEGSRPDQYGLSKDSFWGHYPKLAGFFQVPITGEGRASLLKPMFILFAGLCFAGFLLARGRAAWQLAALTAMVAAAVQLWKTHAGGTYVEWYLPFLLIALMGRGASAEGDDAEPAET